MEFQNTGFQFKILANARPFLKWAGGKTQILENIRVKYPTRLGTTVTKKVLGIEWE